ncbi:MAG: CvpA family protein [Clostridia bacterium]|nr:CvpA family protein [Clostridia bacterium]
MTAETLGLTNPDYVAGLIIDAAFTALIISMTALGYRLGFVRSFVHLFGWIIAIVGAFFWARPVRIFAETKLGLHKVIYDVFFDRLSDSISFTDNISEELPDIISKTVGGITSNITKTAAESLSYFVMSVISFLFVIIAVKLVLYLITRFFSKKGKEGGGVTAFADGIFGAFFSFIKALILSFVILAVLVPIVSLSSPETAKTIAEAIEASHITCELYDNNLLLLIVRDFIH